MKIKITGDPRFIPVAQREGDAGSDIKAAIKGKIEPGETALIPTGFAMQLPTAVAAFILPRSGLALKHGVTVLNAPGLIDSGYRGEVKVLLHNTSSETFFYDEGDRIAQMFLQYYSQPEFCLVDELSESERGTDGFGSSGVK